MSDVDLSKDPCLWITAKNTLYPEFRGVRKPIYILTDGRVASSGELFLTEMSHHPFAKRVGANTKGCEIYGYISRAVLPYSGIIVKVGNVYRELEAGNIELKGYAPDIRVPDGEDALGAAKADFYSRGKDLSMMRGGRTK
jgi:C-terminal processing protease CtpA/Prc